MTDEPHFERFTRQTVRSLTPRRQPSEPLVPPPLPQVAGEAYRIGRDLSNTLVLPGRSVSRFHAEITFRDGGYAIKDWDSSNGTFINDQPVQSAVLQTGDKLRIGDHRFCFDGHHLLPSLEEPPAPDVTEAATPIVVTNAHAVITIEPTRSRAPSTSRAAAVAMALGILFSATWFSNLWSGAAVHTRYRVPTHTVQVEVEGKVRAQPAADFAALGRLMVHLPDIPLDYAPPVTAVRWAEGGSYRCSFTISCREAPRSMTVVAAMDGYEAAAAAGLAIRGGSVQVPDLVLRKELPRPPPGLLKAAASAPPPPHAVPASALPLPLPYPPAR